MYHDEPRPYQLFVREQGIRDNSRRHTNEPAVSVPWHNLSSGQIYLDMAIPLKVPSHQMLKAAVKFMEEDQNYESASDVLLQVMYDTHLVNRKLYANAAVLFQLSSNLEAFQEGRASGYDLTSKLSVGVWCQIEYNVEEGILNSQESDALVDLVRHTLEEYELVAFGYTE
jgi:hypothetical protein